MTQATVLALLQTASGANDQPSNAWPLPSMSYGTLMQRHKESDPERFERIEDLYEGGWAIQKKAANGYLKRRQLEAQKRYEARCETTAYQPYFGQILDQFVADLFSQPLSILPPGDAKNPNTPGEYPDQSFYPELSKNIDGQGTELAALAADVLTTALKHRRAYVQIDTQNPGNVAFANRAQEEAAGAARFYAFELTPDHILDWKADKKGVFAWVILCDTSMERESPSSMRDTVTQTFTVWDMDPDKNVARWARYICRYKKSDGQPKENDPVRLADQGLTSFKRVPILRLEISKGLWVGNKIGPQALEHWKRRSELVAGEAQACLAILFATLGSEIPSLDGDVPAEVAQNPNRAKDPVAQFEKVGALVLGKDDKLQFAEPLGRCFEIVDKQIEGVRDGMFSVNHQMAASIRPTTTALGRSGLSKQKDQESTNKVLGALGRAVRSFFLDVYRLISQARGETVEWVAHGLDSYQVDDRAELLDESMQVQTIAEAIPSETFHKELAKREATRWLPNLPPATVAQIADEIEKGVKALVQKRLAETDAATQKAKAASEVAKNPAPPQPPQNGTVPPQAS